MGRKNVTTNKVNVVREAIAVWTESACERGHRPDRTPVYQGLQYDAAESKIDWLWERKRLLGLELILVSGLVKFVPVVATSVPTCLQHSRNHFQVLFPGVVLERRLGHSALRYSGTHFR